MRRRAINLLFMGAAALAATSLTSCSGGDTLLFLNWGEYVDETLLDAFEEKYNCTVQMDLGESNEIFYSKVKGGTTVYDVVCPSDYMVEKLYANDLLEELDWSLLPNVQKDDLRDYVKQIYTDMDTNLIQNLGDDYTTGTIYNYFVPYLSGTWGIMYTTEKDGIEEAVTNNSVNQWGSLFDRSTLPARTKVAMYDSANHVYNAVCKFISKTDVANAADFDCTKELSQSNLDYIESVIKKMDYNAWGTDTIKKDIVAGNIDLGFMWTGDFLYYYAENAANICMDAYLEGDIEIGDVKNFLDVVTSDTRDYTVGKNTYSIGFDFYIPDDTVAFCDNLVIPKESAHKDLAYKFIDFMSSDSALIDEDDAESEVTPAFSNTYYVDYDAPYNYLYDELVDLTSTEFTDEVAAEFDPDDGDPYDSDLYWLFYDYVIGVSFDKYYPKNEIKGSILAMFDRKYVNKINTTLNNARV
ncbi:MAG: hypothetical protein K6A63_00850 [Acholeplasmatales bacterium]|nr:hypothetical protein [Acholeplasmatales bacterium]